MRDPIHGDIYLPPIHAAVAQSLIFQRLRYIRQNGLLHLVFPGAVHTRFAHSLGTMAVAAKVWSRLLLPIPHALRSKYRRSTEYVGAVFGLAAMLHDVGHCAFSHSIEGVRLNGGPLLGSFAELFRTWKAEPLLRELLTAHPGAEEKEIKHEQIGLILVARLFEESQVVAACRGVFNTEATELGQDVRAVLDDGLRPSKELTACLGELGEMFAKASKTVPLYKNLQERNFPDDLRSILHVLVSGTLDVDRLDYLIRDATFCGVPYGSCDTRILVQGLDIGVVGEHVELLLDSKAASSLDDMLWSRYQMFMQVYNHKTNIALNEMLTQAIPEAIADDCLEAPSGFESYVKFTDDSVMSTVLSLCLHGGKLANTVYGKTLGHRIIPRHLGSRVIRSGDEKEIQKLTNQVARAHGVDSKSIIAAKAKSELVKPGPLPKLLSWNKLTREPILEAFEGRSTLFRDSSLPSVYRLLHFFVER